MGVLDTARDLANLAKEVNRIDLYEKVIELQSQLSELSQRAFDAEAELQSLKERHRISQSLTFSEGAYWQRDGDAWAGPFCSNCWDDAGKLMRMWRQNGINISCPRCRCYARPKLPTVPVVPPGPQAVPPK